MICLSSPSASSNGTWIAPQGSSAAPSLPDSRDLVRASGFASVPFLPRNSVRSPLSVRDRSSTSKKATRPAEFAVVGVAREQRPARRIDLGDDVGRGFRAQVAEHPLDVPGGRQAPRAAGSIAHLEHRELDRVLDIHVDPELGMDAAGGVLEHAVAESMAGPVGHRTARREGRRRPEVAAFLVAQVDRLAGRRTDRIAAPGRQAEFMGILVPGVGDAAFRHARVPKPGFASTLTQGSGVICDCAVVMTYSVPSGVNPPR